MRREYNLIASCDKRKQEPPLPRLFDPPLNSSPQVMPGLDAENLVGNARTKFITAILQMPFFDIRAGPTDEVYHHVAQQMVRKWKFLDTCRKWMCS